MSPRLSDCWEGSSWLKVESTCGNAPLPASAPWLIDFSVQLVITKGHCVSRDDWLVNADIPYIAFYTHPSSYLYVFDFPNTIGQRCLSFALLTHMCLFLLPFNHSLLIISTYTCVSLSIYLFYTSGSPWNILLAIKD